MWQRVQTLYFAISTALLLVLTFGTAGSIITPDAPVEDIRYISRLPYAILIIASLAGNAVSLFCWGHRPLQLKLGTICCILLLGLQIWIGVDYFTMDKAFVFKWTAIFPLIAAIFDILAIRGVTADELLVRSSSRLRAAKRQTNKK